MSSKQFNKKRSFPDGAGSSGSGSGTTSNKSSKFSKSNNGKPSKSNGSFKNNTNGNVGKFSGKPNNNLNENKGKSRSNIKEKEEEVKRRKKPITLGGGEEEDNEDEDEDISMDEDEEFDEDEDEEMGDKALENSGINEEEGQEKKPKLSKSEKLALHAQQPHRTTLLPSHPLLHDTLIPLWETARRADLSKEQRKKTINELYNASKGRIGEISRGHKGGRVLQTIVKFGGKEERTGVAMELESRWKEMMESKYSKFLMSKLIRYCPSIRPLLIPQLAPHLLTLLNHSNAVTPLSDFYDLYATSKERKLLVRGFYPRELKIFDGGKQASETKGLEAFLEDIGTDGKGRERILDSIEKTVLDVFNATQKQALAQSIFHRLVFEYVTCVFKFLDKETAEKKLHELLAAGAESFPEIVHTKDGSAVVRELIVRCNAKDRKQILQPLRKHVEALCKDGDAQMVLFTAFDCVDDTKLMGKAFVSDVVGLATNLAFDKQGRRALLYLLTPTSTKHFMPQTISSLAASAASAKELGTSKKDTELRRKELLGYASEGLLKAVEEKGDEMVRDPGAGMVVQETLLYAQGDKSKAMNTLAKALEIPYPDPAPVEANPDIKTSHPLDLSHSIRTFKTLLSGGHFNTSTKKIEIPDENLSNQFSKLIWKSIFSSSLSEENVIKICKGNAPFVMVELIEALKKSSEEKEFKEIKNVLKKKGVKEQIEQSVRKGSNLLVEKINEL
ncbi:uncharacterized protein I206_103510 [Kwoniella pini CBS 10737]|uniref:Pumilio domain-containing protein n=1 Tax=Kwoniella pini CBS 10737 TaxID=1296096 RepID=A0A1B9I9X1_9TREE|nr:pumilio domain-containing protein [Kwoniella pini CBS 10737]OCF52201.1 pumilio domain-containing protein [Kwoniella pini CBS 10737]